MTETQALVRELLQSMAETIAGLQELTNGDLERDCDHSCAVGGRVRGLLLHNIEHDRSHAAAISNARMKAHLLQDSELARLLRDWMRERTELIGQVLLADDAVLALRGAGDEWDVRTHVEHVLHWERDSVAALATSASPDQP